MKLTESEVQSIVYEAVKKALNEGFMYRTRPEGKPKSAYDVIKGNGWGATTVDKDQRQIILRVFNNSDSWMRMDDPLPFEELVEDLNIYYEDKGSTCRAYGEEKDGGLFITIVKH